MSRVRRQYGSHDVAPLHVGDLQLLLYGAPYGAPTVISRDLSYSPYSWIDICLDSTNPGPPYRVGMPLMIYHRSDPHADIRDSGTYLGPWIPQVLDYVYVGGFYPGCWWYDVAPQFTDSAIRAEEANPGSQWPTEVNAASYGATGWNRFRPGNPTADLGIFLGEIRDVPRMLKGTAKFFQDAWKAMGGNLSKPSKALSNHWLNTQFGWLPFINDLRKFKRTYDGLDKAIRQIKSQNGQWQTKAGSLVDEQIHTLLARDDTRTGHLPSLPGVFYVDQSSTGSKTMTLTKTVNVWFSGSFRYWIPNIESVNWEKRATAELFGAMPNPALIWELTPFSWLVDWVSNVGNVISNLDTGYADNLASRGAYVMKRADYTSEFESTCRLKTATLHSTWTYNMCWKTRGCASPFGFGLTGADFSARQWSILAALGIQHNR